MDALASLLDFGNSEGDFRAILFEKMGKSLDEQAIEELFGERCLDLLEQINESFVISPADRVLGTFQQKLLNAAIESVLGFCLVPCLISEIRGFERPQKFLELSKISLRRPSLSSYSSSEAVRLGKVVSRLWRLTQPTGNRTGAIGFVILSKYSDYLLCALVQLSTHPSSGNPEFEKMLKITMSQCPLEIAMTSFLKLVRATSGQELFWFRSKSSSCLSDLICVDGAIRFLLNALLSDADLGDFSVRSRPIVAMLCGASLKSEDSTRFIVQQLKDVMAQSNHFHAQVACSVVFQLCSSGSFVLSDYFFTLDSLMKMEDMHKELDILRLFLAHGALLNDALAKHVMSLLPLMAHLAFAKDDTKLRELALSILRSFFATAGTLELLSSALDTLMDNPVSTVMEGDVTKVILRGNEIDENMTLSLAELLSNEQRIAWFSHVLSRAFSDSPNASSLVCLAVLAEKYGLEIASSSSSLIEILSQNLTNESELISATSLNLLSVLFSNEAANFGDADHLIQQLTSLSDKTENEQTQSEIALLLGRVSLLRYKSSTTAGVSDSNKMLLTAFQDILDSEPPARAFGLHTLRTLLLSNASLAMEYMPDIERILTASILDSEPYVVTYAVKCWSALIEIYPPTLRMILVRYAETKVLFNTRARYGEVIAQYLTSQEPLQQKQVGSLLSVVKQSSDMSTSGLSLLGLVCSKAMKQVEKHLPEIVSLATHIFSYSEEHEDRRRAFLALINDLIQGLGPDMLQRKVPAGFLLQLQQTLVHVATKDTDPVCAEHACIGLELLSNIPVPTISAAFKQSVAL